MATRLGFDIMLLGAPAAGKDTQALLLRKRYKLKPVESGKHWRKLAAQKNAIGELLRHTFSKGHPTPVRLMREFLNSQLRHASKNTDMLFIGNPRLKPEAQLLNRLLLDRKRDYLVIGISLPAAEIKARSLKRMRDDQDWKYVENRIKMYRLQVSKTLNYFSSLGRLKTVNGNQTVRQVAADILKIIHDHQGRQTTRDPKKKRPNIG
jgi:adenylate kinase